MQIMFIIYVYIGELNVPEQLKKWNNYYNICDNKINHNSMTLKEFKIIYLRANLSNIPWILINYKNFVQEYILKK